MLTAQYIRFIIGADTLFILYLYNSVIKLLKVVNQLNMADQKTKFINSLFLKNLLENKYQQTEVNVKKYTVDAGQHLHKLVIR